MRVRLACDHARHELKRTLAPLLEKRGFELRDFGADALQPDDDHPDCVVPRIAEPGPGRVRGARELAEAFFAASFSGEERHVRRLEKVALFE